MTFRQLLLQTYRERRARNRIRREQARLANVDGFSYTRDHVRFKSEIWERHMPEFTGREGLEMLEIGSHEGRSAIWFLENVLTGANCRLTCVDPLRPEVRLRFEHNIRYAGVEDRIRAIYKRSEYALTDDLLNETFDLIYIDGSHRAPDVLFDAVFAWPLLARGGVMIFDDYGWRPDLQPAERPQTSIDRFMQLLEDEIERVEVGFQVLLRKRT